jgi:hypothetical protein
MTPHPKRSAEHVITALRRSTIKGKRPKVHRDRDRDRVR